MLLLILLSLIMKIIPKFNLNELLISVLNDLLVDSEKIITIIRK